MSRSLIRTTALVSILGFASLVAGCGDNTGAAPPDLAGTTSPGDFAATTQPWDLAEISPSGECPTGPYQTEHICNNAGGGGPLTFCLYRETNLACVLCAPVGCKGTLDAHADQGIYDYICVSSCDECQPGKPHALCLTE